MIHDENVLKALKAARRGVRTGNHITLHDAFKVLDRAGVFRELDEQIRQAEIDNGQRCPNGQNRRECSEIDPCEMCWQDQQDEGDMIEESMGLRSSGGCHGCTGTCCTGVGSDPCTC
jgi:hypothetical protein